MTGNALLKKDYWTAHLWLQMCSDPKIFQNCSMTIQIAIQKSVEQKFMVCLHCWLINLQEAGSLLPTDWGYYCCSPVDRSGSSPKPGGLPKDVLVL